MIVALELDAEVVIATRPHAIEAGHALVLRRDGGGAATPTTRRQGETPTTTRPRRQRHRGVVACGGDGRRPKQARGRSGGEIWVTRWWNQSVRAAATKREGGGLDLAVVACGGDEIGRFGGGGAVITRGLGMEQLRGRICFTTHAQV